MHAGDRGSLRAFPATAMPDRDWWSALWPDPERLLKTLGVPRGEAAVDLCCGDGYFTVPMSRLAAPGAVYAIELDPRVLDQAIKFVTAREGTNCVFIEGDARNIADHVPGTVGFVLLANTFHGVPDKTGLTREVRKVLTPQGRFAVVNWHPMPREKTRILGQPRGPATRLRISPEKTREIIELAGFTLEELADLPPYHYGAIFMPD